jgi:hypothetical protein
MLTDQYPELEVTAMEYVSLGRSGLKVSRVCMGTMTCGAQADVV